MHSLRHYYFIKDAADITISNAMADRVFNCMAHRLCVYIGHSAFDK